MGGDLRREKTQYQKCSTCDKELGAGEGREEGCGGMGEGGGVGEGGLVTSMS